MSLSNIRNCFEKRRLTKGEVWDRGVRQTTASRWVRAHADQEVVLHGVDLYRCAVCDSYSTNGLIHVAHIIASSSFADDVPLGVINHICNLLPLCQTCHRKNDSVRHDKKWTMHRYDVLEEVERRMEIVQYIHDDIIYPYPFNLDNLYKEIKKLLFYEKFVDCPFIIRNTGKRYRKPDSNLYELRNKMMGEATNHETKNGSPYYTHRQHGKFEAYKHKMYDDVRCLICDETNDCDVSHANRLCDISPEVPLGVVNHPHNLIWLCPNHNHILDNPPGTNETDQYRKEYDEFMITLQERLIVHRQKFNQIPIRGQSFLFNPISVNNWRVIEA